MRYLFGLFLSLLFMRCSDKKDREIVIGTYSFIAPFDFRFEKEDAFNTQVGQIVTDSFALKYEYSNHTKPLILTPREFIESGLWKADLARELFTEKKFKNVHEIKFLSTRTASKRDSSIGNGCDFVASCSYDSLSFEAPIYLPKDTEESRFILDTVGGSYRKIFLANDSWEGRSGIYLQDISTKAIQTNNYYSLILWTEHLTKNQQETLLKMLLTAKVIHNN